MVDLTTVLKTTTKKKCKQVHDNDDILGLYSVLESDVKTIRSKVTTFKDYYAFKIEVKFNSDNWKVWDSLMVASADCDYFEEVTIDI